MIRAHTTHTMMHDAHSSQCYSTQYPGTQCMNTAGIHQNEQCTRYCTYSTEPCCAAATATTSPVTGTLKMRAGPPLRAATRNVLAYGAEHPPPGCGKK